MADPTFAEMMAMVNDPDQTHECERCEKTYTGPDKGTSDDSGEFWFCDGCWAEMDRLGLVVDSDQ